MFEFAKRLGSHLATHVGEKFTTDHLAGTGTIVPISDRIRARYTSACKQRPSSRKLMREYDVLDDWKEAWDRS